MFKLFDGNSAAGIYYSGFEKKCIVSAIGDLQKDIYSVSGKKIGARNYLPTESKGQVVIGTLKNAVFAKYAKENAIDVSAIEGQWENYMIKTIGDTLVIAGSDDRGTMWGIYEFSRIYLGIDPLYLWTDYVAEKKTELVLENVDIVDGPKSFKFRGWFINDEDLIEGFSKGSPFKRGEYDFHKDYAPMLSMLVETALRLKQNLFIPCSLLNILKPEEEALISIVTERGMYISMHHQEPVGVHQIVMDKYWKDRGIEEQINYFDYKEQYEQVWREYVRKWSKYDNVIWQLGLRGRGDRPVWFNATGVPEDTPGRGRMISAAIQRQYDIIKEENPGKEILTSATLWMEGMGLYKENVLKFPEGTIVVFADFAPEQMWGEGYYTTAREENRDYGLYYHVGFWGCGPHLVQGNRPEKIYYNYKNAVDKGDNCYSILNVANFREHVYNTKCVADITWDINSFDVDSFRKEWCQYEYKTADTACLEEVYKEYYECFYKMDNELISGHMILMDGMCRRVALKLMEVISGKELKRVDIQNFRLFDFDDTDEFVQHYMDATAEGIARFKRLYSKAVAALNVVAEDRKQFYINNVIVQTEIIMALYSWVNSLCKAAADRRGEKNDEKYSAHIDEALFAISKLNIDRTKACGGKWEHWYDGDYLMDMRGAAELTKALMLGTDTNGKDLTNLIM